MKKLLTRFSCATAIGCVITLASCVNPYLGPGGLAARGASLRGQSHTVRTLGLLGRGHPLAYRAQPRPVRYLSSNPPVIYRRPCTPVMLASSRHGFHHYGPGWGYASPPRIRTPFRPVAAVGFGPSFGFRHFGW